MPEYRKKFSTVTAVAALALAIGGCSMEPTSPSAARDSASAAESLSLSAAGGTDCARPSA